MNEIDQAIRRAIREAMLEQGLTQAGLAQKLGVKQPSVAQLVNGKYGAIPVSLLNALDALGLEIVIQPKQP